MFQSLAGGDPFVGIDRQHLIDEVLSFMRDSIPFWARIVVCAYLDLGIETMLIFVPEGWISNEEDVKDHTTRPNVDRFAIGLLLEDLRTQVTGCPGKSFLRTTLIHSPERSRILDSSATQTGTPTFSQLSDIYHSVSSTRTIFSNFF